MCETERAGKSGAWCQVIQRCQSLLSDSGAEHHSRPNLVPHPSVGGLSIRQKCTPASV